MTAEETVGYIGEPEDGRVIATLLDGRRVIECAQCGTGVYEDYIEGHRAQHRRRSVVDESARAMNLRGVDYQPGQRWAAKAKARRRAAR